MNRFPPPLPLPLGTLVLLGACAAPTPSEPTTVPVAQAHGLVFVEVELGGDSLLALVDTGANASAIDPRHARALPLLETTEIVGTTGNLQADVVAVDGLRLGTHRFPRLRATRRDLGGLLPLDGRTVDMILGSDALAGHAVTIDFERDLLTIGASPPADAGAGTGLVLDDGIPAIRAELGGVSLWLRIDTGASLFATSDVYVNVPVTVWDALRAHDPDLAPTASLQGTGADGTAVDLPVARIAPASIGELVFEHVHVIVQPSAGYFARPDAKGFVSNNYLRRLGRVTLDYAGGRLLARTGTSARDRRR